VGTPENLTYVTETKTDTIKKERTGKAAAET
jgi:hypothetical protein